MRNDYTQLLYSGLGVLKEEVGRLTDWRNTMRVASIAVSAIVGSLALDAEHSLGIDPASASTAKQIAALNTLNLDIATAQNLEGRIDMTVRDNMQNYFKTAAQPTLSVVLPAAPTKPGRKPQIAQAAKPTGPV